MLHHLEIQKNDNYLERLLYRFLLIFSICKRGLDIFNVSDFFIYLY
jgi:hypothetical protein